MYKKSEPKNKHKKPRHRFMAMSKLIGLICFWFLLAVIIYSMYEMHVTKDLSNLGQLIISAFAFASIYAGFYLTMAKVEHLEEEKSRCKKELEMIRCNNDYTEEDAELHKKEIESVLEQLNNLMTQDIHSIT